MTNHPITPSPELVEQWFDKSPLDRGLTLATQSAQWGADQELEACCEWSSWRHSRQIADQLRDARRPKPPSEAEQALEAFKRFTSGNNGIVDDMRDGSLIRRALERLQQLEEKSYE